MRIFFLIYSYLITINKDTKGASAIEYAIIAGLIAVAIIVAVTALGGGIGATFQRITNALSGVGGSGT
ncbi:Flp family type IVb pilin [Halomonas aquamarina]|uniref:Flp family type IVb pilin n=1 Tax=Vreelandella aquamarina TaxID=77097 RepID=A0ACC5VRW3_9GAMM|nr:Flp family type IVb pilin [Halomonas aquamarina]MBZ5487038.1 Flp family type IVb pilin [Halomonas aquamarina]